MFIENNNTKKRKKKKEGKKEFGRTRTQHHRLDATTPNHYTTETDYVMNEKSLIQSLFMKPPPARWSPAALIELLTIKKQCKRIFHGNEWMKEHNYAFQNADTRPRLQRRTQNICFVISISPTVILKRMVKITSIFGSYKFLRVAWHDIFSLSHHLLASWNLYIPRVAESKSKCSSSRQV